MTCPGVSPHTAPTENVVLRVEYTCPCTVWPRSEARGCEHEREHRECDPQDSLGTHHDHPCHFRQDLPWTTPWRRSLPSQQEHTSSWCSSLHLTILVSYLVKLFKTVPILWNSFYGWCITHPGAQTVSPDSASCSPEVSQLAPPGTMSSSGFHWCHETALSSLFWKSLSPAPSPGNMKDGLDELSLIGLLLTMELQLNCLTSTSVAWPSTETRCSKCLRCWTNLRLQERV